MNRKISTYRSLLHLVALDETKHVIKDIAELFLSALRDWPTDNRQDIVKCIQEFKDYFGDPMPFVDSRSIHRIKVEGWWQEEAGASLSQMIDLSIKHFGAEDFDTIVDRVLSYYEQKFLMTSAQRPIKSTGYAYFNIWTSSEEKEVDYVHWLGLESEKIKSIHGLIGTPMTLNTVSNNLIQRIVNCLTPLKDRLIALKQEHPDLHFVLAVLFWTNPVDLHVDLDNETLRFFAETGIEFRNELFII